MRDTATCFSSSAGRAQRPTVRLGRVLIAALGLAGVLLIVVMSGWSARPAGADENVWYRLGCGTSYQADFFGVVTSTPEDSLQLKVTHKPGTFGTLEVKTKVESEYHPVWQFTQPSHWISGEYHQDSPKLEPGVYLAQYWSHNLAQAQALCNSTLTLRGSGQ